jgi:hypothetical protein
LLLGSNCVHLRAAKACVLVAVLTALVAALLAPGAGSADTAPVIGGAVPPHGSSAKVAALAAPAANQETGKAGTGGDLIWHGGPVMHSNTTYTIFWAPPGQSMPAGYESTINQFFADVAHDSGGSANVYSSDVQYTDATDRANYASSFGGTWEDTGTPIPNHCAAYYTNTFKVSGCVVDLDLQTEVAHAIAVNHWTPGPTALFLVFTPPDVGSCSVAGSAKDCSYKTYCAYHSYFTPDSSTDVLYTNQPFPDTTKVGIPGVCDSGSQPNGNWADAAINLASHEHNEAVTDPLITAWYDSQSNEDGDKCAWSFGAALGGAAGTGTTEGTQWNQLINGDHYYLQREWDNASSSCVQRVAAPSAATPALVGFAPASGAPGTTVTITGGHLSNATSVKFGGIEALFSVVDDSTITATVPATAVSGPISVTTPGGTVSSSASFGVLDLTPDFTVSVDGAQTVTHGQSATYTVTIARLNGYSSSVALSATVTPQAAVMPTAAFTPRTIQQGSTTSVLTVKTKRLTTPGTYTVTVTGSRNGVSHSATTTITVQ